MDELCDNPALSEQVSALLESTTILQQKVSQVLIQLSAHPQNGQPAQSYPYTVQPTHSRSQVHFELNTPASAQASILAPGVPIPSRGWQMDHSPKAKVVERTRIRLMKDGWPDCEDTDQHAARLSEAMLRMGLEDLDNFATEASRLNCSNMAISATLVSAVVATFVSETYSDHDSFHMQVVNSLWLLSLFLSLAVATLCMLVSEWLTWSTSQELRDHSVLYRLIRTAFRSLLMHMSIFLFFAGLMVLMWNESTVAVCIVPSIAVGIFIIYYVTATVRPPFIALVHSVRQWGEDDFRGLRVQIWTPFSLTTHHTVDCIIKYGVKPLMNLFERFSGPSVSEEEARAHASDRPQRPTLKTDTSEHNGTQKTITPMNHSATPTVAYSPNVTANLPNPPTLTPERSPVWGRPLHQTGVESPHSISRAGTPASESVAMDAEIEHQRKLRAMRIRRTTEHEFLRPGRGSRLPDV